MHTDLHAFCVTVKLCTAKGSCPILNKQSESDAAAPAASRGHGPKARPAAQVDTEPSQRQRGQPQAHPNSPPLPPLSSSIHPAIQAKLQQAHNKLLGQSRPSNKPEESTASARPAAGKPGPRAGQKGKANSQPQPTQGQSRLLLHGVCLY